MARGALAVGLVVGLTAMGCGGDDSSEGPGEAVSEDLLHGLECPNEGDVITTAYDLDTDAPGYATPQIAMAKFLAAEGFHGGEGSDLRPEDFTGPAVEGDRKIALSFVSGGTKLAHVWIERIDDGWRVVGNVFCRGALDATAAEGRAAALTRDEYQAEIHRITADTEEATTLFFDVVYGERPSAECAELVGRLHDEVDRLIDQAAALRPPADVATVHQEFLTPAQESVRRIEEIQAQVESGEVSCGRELNGVLYGMPSTEDAERAIAEIERQDYVVFGE